MYPIVPRRGNGFHFSTLLSLCILAFAVFAFIQAGRTVKDAELGLLRFEERQKDLFVDAGLITEASRLVPLSRSAAALRSQTVIVGRRSRTTGLSWAAALFWAVRRAAS